jgi:hypothetical protein
MPGKPRQPAHHRWLSPDVQEIAAGKTWRLQFHYQWPDFLFPAYSPPVTCRFFTQSVSYPGGFDWVREMLFTHKSVNNLTNYLPGKAQYAYMRLKHLLIYTT